MAVLTYLCAEHGTNLVVLIVIGLFLIRKKVAIREMFGDLKKELAESVNSLIDRINKR